MRRILLALMSTLTAVVLLFGYRTSTAHPASTATATVAAGTPGSASSAGATTGTAPAAPQSTSSSAGTKAGTAPITGSKTVTGQTVQTRWGPVQVQLTIAGNKITAVDVLQSPSGNDKDVEINSSALPVLMQETLQAQNAHIDSVSGATYTSTGYLTSLQSALVQAGL